jgi:site-specific recombinase XerC
MDETSIDNYINHLIIKNYSKVTTNAYKSILLKNVGLSGDQIKERMFKEGLDFNSINLNLIVQKGFYRFMGWDVSGFGLCKVSQKKLDVPDFDKLVSLREGLFGCERAVFELLLSTGLRVSEMCSLNFDDLKGSQVSVVGKGGKVRLVFVSERAKIAILEGVRGEKVGGVIEPLIINSKGGRLSVRSVQKMFEKWSRLLGVRVTPHMMRHLFAVQLLESGSDVFVVKEMLGHSDIKTTCRYLHVSNMRLEEAHRKMVVFQER